MEGAGRDIESVIKLLRRHRELEFQNYKDYDSRMKAEETVRLTELSVLQDKQAQIKENITKNLKSLIMQKHGLQKVVRSLEQDIPKLPVTHKYHWDAINFVSDSIKFVNSFPEINKSVTPENNIDTLKLCQEINTCGECANQALNRSVTCVDQIVIFKEDTELIRTHFSLSCDDDPAMTGQ